MKRRRPYYLEQGYFQTDENVFREAALRLLNRGKAELAGDLVSEADRCISPPSRK